MTLNDAAAAAKPATGALRRRKAPPRRLPTAPPAAPCPITAVEAARPPAAQAIVATKDESEAACAAPQPARGEQIAAAAHAGEAATARGAAQGAAAARAGAAMSRGRLSVETSARCAPVATPHSSAGAAAPPKLSVAPLMLLKSSASASYPAAAATPQREPLQAIHAPSAAAAGPSAPASSPMQDKQVCWRSSARQAAKRAAAAISSFHSPSGGGQLLNDVGKAAKQARKSSASRQLQKQQKQQQLESRIQSLAQQLSSPEEGRQAEAAVSLARLVYESEKNSSCIVAAGAVQPLIALLSSSDSSCQTAAAYALFNLWCTDDITCNEIRAAGGMLPLVTMLTSSNPKCQVAAAELLREIAGTEPGAAAVLGTAGSFAAAVGLLHSTDDTVVTIALRLLNRLVFKRADTVIALAEVVPLVCQQFSANRSEEIQLEAASVLAVMGASDATVVDAAMMQTAAAAVVRLLDSREHDALEAAADMATYYPNTRALQEAIPRVTALLCECGNSCSNDSIISGRGHAHGRSIARQATRFLCHMMMTCDDSVLGTIAAADSLTSLIKCVQSQRALCDEGMGFALGAVDSLINMDSERQRAAVAAGIVGTCVQLLKDSSDEYVLGNALAILWAVAETNDTVQVEVLSRQATSTVVLLLGHSDIKVQHHAAGLLMGLAKSSKAIKAEAVAAGAVASLAQLLVRVSDSNVLEDVIGALHSLAVDSDEKQAAVATETGAIKRLQELLSTILGSTAEHSAAAVLKLLERHCG